MPDMAVRTAFTAQDKLSPAFKKMGKEAQAFGKTGQRAFKRFNSGGLSATSIVKRLAFAMGGLMVVRKIGSQFIEFDHAITAASAKFPGLSDGSEESIKSLKDLRATARLVGRDTQFSADQAAQGLDFLAMAGFDAKQSMDLLPGVANLATVANTDFARATDIASDALGAFGLMTKDSGQLATNFNRVNDVMAATMTRSNTSMEDLFESVKKGAASFTAAGQSVESFNALAGVMANSGLKGAESGTQLRNIMLRLASPTKEAGRIMENIGVQTQDADGNFRDVVDIIGDFEKGLKGMGNAQRSAALATVFGARSVTGMNILLQEGSGNIKDFRAGLEGADGAAGKMAGTMRGSLKNQIASLGSAFTELGFKIIDGFSKDGGNAIEDLTQTLRDLGPTFEKVGNIISKIVPYLPKLVGGFLLYRAALIGVTTYQKINLLLSKKQILFAKILKAKMIALAIGSKIRAAGLAIVNAAQKINLLLSKKQLLIAGILKAKMIALAIGSKIWAAGLAIVNAVMYANPAVLIIMAIIASVAAVIAIGILLYKNWDVIKEKAGIVFNIVKNHFVGVWETFKFIFAKIKSFGLAVWEGLKLGFTIAIDFIKKIFFTFADYFLTIWGNIIKGVLGAASKIGSVFGMDTSGIDNVIGKVDTLQKTVRSQSFFGDGGGVPSGGGMSAPNASDVQARYSNNTTVNVNNAQPGTTASVSPKKNARVNMAMVGAN